MQSLLSARIPETDPTNYESELSDYMNNNCNNTIYCTYYTVQTIWPLLFQGWGVTSLLIVLCVGISIFPKTAML